MAGDAITGRDTGDEATQAVAAVPAGTVRRRGLIAAAAAMAVGLAARHAADATPVAAETTDTNFTATGTVNNFDARGTANYGVDTYNGTFRTGVYGKGSLTGVVGFGTGTSSTGVYAYAPTSGSTGVYAQGGAFGVNATTSGSGGVGVRSEASGTGSYGVLATTTAAGSIALGGYAYGPGSYGVYGTSATSHGVYGITAAPGQSSVYGYAVAKGAAAISGVAGSAAYAGTFTGAVVVNGDFVAYGGVKSGAVPHPDGSHRLLYCVESPEAWFEDYGEAKLTAGRVEVEIDPDFAAVVDTRKMHVFITEHDEHQALSVKRRGTKGFVVEADATVAAMRGKKMTDMGGTFSYRVVAKRKDAREGRLAKFTLPKTERTDAAPMVPKAPESPKVPERPDGR